MDGAPNECQPGFQQLPDPADHVWYIEKTGSQEHAQYSWYRLLLLWACYRWSRGESKPWNLHWHASSFPGELIRLKTRTRNEWNGKAPKTILIGLPTFLGRIKIKSANFVSLLSSWREHYCGTIQTQKSLISWLSVKYLFIVRCSRTGSGTIIVLIRLTQCLLDHNVPIVNAGDHISMSQCLHSPVYYKINLPNSCPLTALLKGLTECIYQ